MTIIKSFLAHVSIESFGFGRIHHCSIHVYINIEEVHLEVYLFQLKSRDGVSCCHPCFVSGEIASFHYDLPNDMHIKGGIPELPLILHIVGILSKTQEAVVFQCQSSKQLSQLVDFG